MIYMEKKKLETIKAGLRLKIRTGGVTVENLPPSVNGGKARDHAAKITNF